MFNQVKVPLIRVVENMSYFVCSVASLMRTFPDRSRVNPANSASQGRDGLGSARQATRFSRTAHRGRERAPKRYGCSSRRSRAGHSTLAA
jgi:hypothetical protein